MATSVVGDQLSQKLTSWLGGGGAKGGEDAAATQAAGQSESGASGFQGDESFTHVPTSGATTSSSGFEEVPVMDDDMGAGDDDDDAFD